MLTVPKKIHPIRAWVAWWQQKHEARLAGRKERKMID